MYNQSLIDSIISKIDAKINLVVLNHLDESNSFSFESALFRVCFLIAIAAIVTGIAVNLHYHNLFY